MKRSSGSISVLDWSAQALPGGKGHHGLFNSDALAAANRLEGHAPFAVQVNESRYFAYRRHASAVVGGLALEDMVALLENIPDVKASLGPMGIKSLSLNSLNAVNDRDSLATAIKLGCSLRFEFLLDITQYSTAGISSNHKRNIKKSTKADAEVTFAVDPEAMRAHIDLVNMNLGNKGVGGITNSPEYFRYLIQNNAGLLMQVTQNEQLLASTFFIINQDYAYYHSSGTSDQGKHLGAAHFLVDRMIDEMRERHMRYLNFGGCTSEQTGLYRFKMGFRPQTRVLASASRRLALTPKQRIRSLLSTRPGDILNVNRVNVYKKTFSSFSSLDLEDYAVVEMSYDSLFNAVSVAPELSPCLEIYCRSRPHCYALVGGQEQVLAVGFIEATEINRNTVAGGHSLPADAAEFTHIQVVSNMRAKGIGRLLVGLLESEVLNMGLNKACSKVCVKDTASQKMFLAAGFKLAGEEKIVSSAILGGGSRIIGRIDV